MSELVIRSLPHDGAKQLARELKKIAPNLQCNICGGRDFALIEQPDADFRTTLRRVHVGPDIRPDIHQALVTAICTTCGHLEQFAEAILKGATADKYGKDHTSE